MNPLVLSRMCKKVRLLTSSEVVLEVAMASRYDNYCFTMLSVWNNTMIMVS